MPTYIVADGPDVPIGSLCAVATRSGRIHAEVIRVDNDSVTLSPFETGAAVYSGALVQACGDANTTLVGAAFLGRAIDAMGAPLDGGADIPSGPQGSLAGIAIGPLERMSSAEAFETGLRAIDGLLPLAQGQRIGLFAASGAGKTSLMEQIALQALADVTIICLVGERGREVEELWNRSLDAVARRRCILVAATAEQSAAKRVRAAHVALAHAEYWRGQGKHVLLLLDSMTRLAMAMREMGLAAGDPPTVRAYTPGVFAAIPKLVERCGALRDGGAITAIITVLSETDDVDDPVCEIMKSLLDGHIVLSRTLAERGQFPAIDVPRSVSRRAETLMSDAQRRQAVKVVEWLGLQDASRTLVETGLYAKGTNPALDEALARYPAIVRFLKQNRDERAALPATEAALAELVGPA
jgi:flagellum-specific ATP synthase